VELAAPRATRRMRVEDFLTGYRRNALAPEELILAIHLPRPPAGALLVAEKLSRRHDQDISALSLVACLTLEAGVVRQARLAWRLLNIIFFSRGYSLPFVFYSLESFFFFLREGRASLFGQLHSPFHQGCPGGCRLPGVGFF
jgi:hypothetical protein